MRVHEATAVYAAGLPEGKLVESMNRERLDWPSVKQQNSSVREAFAASETCRKETEP